MSTDTTIPDEIERKAAHDTYAADVYRALALRLFARYEDMRGAAEFHGADPAERLGPSDIGCAILGEQYREAVDKFLFEDADTGFAAQAAIKFIGVVAADRLMGEIGEGAGNAEPADMLHVLLMAQQVFGWTIESVNREWMARRRELKGSAG